MGVPSPEILPTYLVFRWWFVVNKFKWAASASDGAGDVKQDCVRLNLYHHDSA
jgi:hypothetical protein